MGWVINDFILSSQFLFSPFWGTISDRIGRRPVLMIGLIGNTVFFAMFGLANTLLIALLARFLAGVFNGNLAVAKAYIGDVSTPSQLTSRMGIIGAALVLDSQLGHLSAVNCLIQQQGGNFCDTIFDTYPYLLPCIAAGALSLVSLIFAYFKLPESLPKTKRSNFDSVSWTSRIGNSVKQSFSMLNKGTISVIIWVKMLFIFGFTIMHAVFILYTGMAIDEGGLSYNEAQNGRLFAIIGITGIITQGVLIGPLSSALAQIICYLYLVFYVV